MSYKNRVKNDTLSYPRNDKIHVLCGKIQNNKHDSESYPALKFHICRNLPYFSIHPECKYLENFIYLKESYVFELSNSS